MELITQLEQTLEKTVEHYALSEEDLNKIYPGGSWTIRQILVHLTDAEGVLLERIKRTIAEPKPLIFGFDQDLWSTHLDYATYPLAVSKALFVATRQSVLHLAKNHYSSAETKSYVHNQTGVQSLKQEFDKVVRHNASHLKQIEQALKL